MKKILALLCVTVFLLSSIAALAEEDPYAYLDDMTVKELRALDAAIHERLGGGETVNVSASYTIIGTQQPTLEEPVEFFFDEPIVVLDDERARITVSGKYYKVDAQNRSEMGYYVLVENKTDKYLEVVATDQSLNGFMLGLQDGPWLDPAFVSPQMKANAKLYFQPERMESVKLNSLADMVELKGIWQLITSDDGMSYSSADMTKPEFLCPIP